MYSYGPAYEGCGLYKSSHSDWYRCDHRRAWAYLSPVTVADGIVVTIGGHRNSSWVVVAGLFVSVASSTGGGVCKVGLQGSSCNAHKASLMRLRVPCPSLLESGHFRYAAYFSGLGSEPQES